MTDSINILFVCTENACRSQIAEGWASTLHRDNIAVKSAGIVANGVNGSAVVVMKECAVDISRQSSDVIKAEDFEQADIIVTVCEQADRRCPPLPAGKIKYHWPIKNPVSQVGDNERSLEAFRRCRDELKKRIITLFQMEGICYDASAEHAAPVLEKMV